MKAIELVKKLGHKLLGKKVSALAVGDAANLNQTAPDEKAPVIPLLDGLGVIQLHEDWRN